MRGNEIDVYYFSGTGNTLLVVRELVKPLVAAGKIVNLQRLETSDPNMVNVQHVIGLAFPVAVFSTYPFVWDFIHQLPQGAQTEIFMLDTLAGFSGGIKGPLKKTLIRKHYQPIGAREFIMPSNYLRMKSAEKNQRIVAKAMVKVQKYAEALLNGKAKWRRIPILSDIVCLLSRSKMPWRSMSKKMYVQEEKCIRCGLCTRLCPVKAIQFDETPENSAPKKDNLRCQVCMRCLSFCPAKAIAFKGHEEQKRYHAVVATELLAD